MVDIIVPGNWRTVAGVNTARLNCDADTVHAALRWLTTTYPPLRERVFTSDGALAAVINVYVDEENIRHLDGLATKLAPGSVLTLLPALVGG